MHGESRRNEEGEERRGVTGFQEEARRREP